MANDKTHWRKMSDLLNCWKCGHEAYVEEGDYDYCRAGCTRCDNEASIYGNYQAVVDTWNEEQLGIGGVE